MELARSNSWQKNQFVLQGSSVRTRQRTTSAPNVILKKISQLKVLESQRVEDSTLVSIKCAAIPPDISFMAIGGYKGFIIIDPTDYSVIVHRKDISGLAIDQLFIEPDMTALWSLSLQHASKWDINNDFTPILDISSADYLQCFCPSHDDLWLASLHLTKHIEFTSPPNQTKTTLQKCQYWTHGTFLPKSDLLITTSQNSPLKLHNRTTGKLLSTITPKAKGQITSLTSNKDETFLATGTNEGVIEVYKMGHSQPHIFYNKVIRDSEGSSKGDMCVQFHGFLDRLISVGQDGRFCVWGGDKWDRLMVCKLGGWSDVACIVVAPAGDECFVVASTSRQIAHCRLAAPLEYLAFMRRFVKISLFTRLDIDLFEDLLTEY